MSPSPVDERVLRLAAAVTAALLLLPLSSASAAFCSVGDTLLPDPSQVAPVAMVTSPNPGHYFLYEFKNGDGIKAGMLAGITHEFLCHVPQPSRDGVTCTLANYPNRISDLGTASGNLLRMYAVLNHSPGRAAGGAPFNYEQPFTTDQSGKWNLGAIDGLHFLPDLDAVVKTAYCWHVIVELTLLDPWDGDWTTGPFYSQNTVGAQGFPSARMFISFENLASGTDTSSAVLTARAAQKSAVQNVVSQLKKYPNLIWEIANEPDFYPSGSGLTPANVRDFEASVVSWITAKDTTHLIMGEGHQDNAFGWTIGGVSVASAHYVAINDAREGAIEVLRDASKASARAGVATAFNENKAFGLTGVIQDGIRAEAWDFAFNGGNSFDAYSLNYNGAAALTNQLGKLAKMMRNVTVFPTPYFPQVESLQQAHCNQSGDWCSGVPAYGSADHICSADGQTFWSTLKSSASNAFGLYLHHGVQITDPGTPGNPFVRYDARRCTTPPLYALSNFKISVPTTGCWQLTWTRPEDLVTLSSSFQYISTPNTPIARPSPAFADDIAVFLNLYSSGPCS